MENKIHEEWYLIDSSDVVHTHDAFANKESAIRDGMWEYRMSFNGEMTELFELYNKETIEDAVFSVGKRVDNDEYDFMLEDIEEIHCKDYWTNEIIEDLKVN